MYLIISDVEHLAPLEKYFKSFILNMLKELEETTDREPKEARRTMSQQVENIKKRQMLKKELNRNTGAEK